MADIDYLYTPYYGVEPFDVSTTGAKLTGQNLVVTAWNLLEKTDPGFVIGEILLPASQNDNLATVRKEAAVQAFHSRHSAQMFFMNEPGLKPVPVGGIMLVLNPPPEMKQLLAKAVVFNGGDPIDPASYTINRSIMSAYMWRALVENAEENQNGVSSIENSILFGTPIDLGTYAGIDDTQIPFLRTSGADGQTPTFFDTLTAEGTAEMLAAINAGDYFVPLGIVSDFDASAVRLTITYPHSLARG